MNLKEYLINKSALGIEASSINIDKIQQINTPKQLRDEIPTLNRMGYMKMELDEYSAAFVQHASESKDWVLEVGCAYGFVVNKLLEAGGKIIASDLSEEHLSVLLMNAPKKFLKNLNLYPGKFPNDISLPQESISAVLASRILHFLDGETIKECFDKIHYWLAKEGKFFFVAITPYHETIREKFLSQYFNNVKNGEEWPGVIENQWELAPQHKEYVEPYLNVFDVTQLEKLLPQHGFKIEKISLFNYVNDVTAGDKGHIGFIASKV